MGKKKNVDPIEKKLEEYDALKKLQQKLFVQQLLKENTELQEEVYKADQKRKRYFNEVLSLSNSLNKHFYAGKYQNMVMLKNAETFMFYQLIKEIAVKDGNTKNNNKGQYPYEYCATIEGLAQQFNTSKYHIRKYIQNLKDMGAIKERRVKQNKFVVYELGKRVKTPHGYKQSFLLQLSNRKTKKWLKEMKNKEAQSMKKSENRDEDGESGH